MFSVIVHVQRAKRPAPTRRKTGALLTSTQSDREVISSPGRLERFLLGQHGTRCAKICYDMVIALSDQQLATAIALLVAAIKKLHVDKDISIYHFDLVFASAFLNSAIFISATISYHAMVEWEGFKEGRGKLPLPSTGSEPGVSEKRWWQEAPWAIRIILILTLDGLLIYGGSVSGRNKEVRRECPAFCFQVEAQDEKPPTTIDPLWYTLWVWLIVSNIIDYYNLAVVYKWWPPKSPFMSAVARKVRDISKDSVLEMCSFMVTSRFPSLCVGYCIVVIYEVQFFVSWRSKTQFEEEEPGAEDSMGFGQIVPLFLLILLLVQLINSISGM